MSKRKTKKQENKPAKVPKMPKGPKPDLCVFAFRLPLADRDVIHKAAGPGKATRFVLAAALAAANQDSKAFDELIAQARSSTK